MVCVIVGEIQPVFCRLYLPSGSQSCNCSFPHGLFACSSLQFGKELSVGLRTSLCYKWIQFRSCARCEMHTLKQGICSDAHIDTHTFSHSALQYLSCMAFMLTLFLCPFTHFCASVLLFLPGCGAGSGATLATE